ncbi:class I adenylate-forming enzyme family protein [Hutsoniella sourekii]|uniref:class I adenylate-forming enzyme family protein n=1 Tax=Hutsoniella sourekii TaxID=87650 RepID=UPI0004884571|nr:AMP-binding protein [Hutsoniella sourekii]
MNVDWLASHASFNKEKIALVDSDTKETYTYEQLNERAMRMAKYLKQFKVMPGDRVALLAPNHIAYLDLFFACCKIGAVFVPLNWMLNDSEVTYILNDSSPRFTLYINDDPRHTHLDHSSVIRLKTDQYEDILSSINASDFQANNVRLDQTAFIIYTGGTTGRSKGVMITHRHIASNAVNTALGWGISPESSTITFSPLFHLAGLNGLVLPILWMGGRVVLVKAYQAHQSLCLLYHYQPSHIFMVPTMYYSLINEEHFDPDQLRSVKLFVTGGAPASDSVLETFAKNDLPLINSFGLSEAGPNNFYISPERAKAKPKSVGRPIPPITVKLLDDEGKEVGVGETGEIHIRSDHTFLGYWNLPNETAETLVDGFVKTGDLAKVDQDGDYFIVGRKKDIIISGGENIYPIEIEETMLNHPLVQDVAVVGYQDDYWGEAVGAAIIPSTDGNPSFEDMQEILTAYLKDNLARYKVPKRFLFLEAFPTTPVGKTDRLALAKQFLSHNVA